MYGQTGYIMIVNAPKNYDWIFKSKFILNMKLVPHASKCVDYT